MNVYHVKINIIILIMCTILVFFVDNLYHKHYLDCAYNLMGVLGLLIMYNLTKGK